MMGSHLINCSNLGIYKSTPNSFKCIEEELHENEDSGGEILRTKSQSTHRLARERNSKFTRK